MPGTRPGMTKERLVPLAPRRASSQPAHSALTFFYSHSDSVEGRGMVNAK
jgi:hypothetical protein